MRRTLAMWRRWTYLGCPWKLPFVCICNYVHINKLVRCIYCTLNPMTKLLSSAKLPSELGHLAKKSSFMVKLVNFRHGYFRRWLRSELGDPWWVPGGSLVGPVAVGVLPRKLRNLRTILFVDELHRWTKAQQDGGRRGFVFWCPV